VSEKVLTARFGKPQSQAIAGYLADGGYGALKKVLDMGPQAVVEEIKKAALRGRGGAGFPAGVKWSFVPRPSPRPVYLCVNADEGEPGTFKDRALMENDPHQLIEGAAIACLAIGAHRAYIYVRGEFRKSIQILEKALEEAQSQGFLGRDILGSGYQLEMYVHPGAGAYICGEETALIESNEGHRGMPRLKPPFPAQEGLFGGPTVVNNVETLCCVPHIINRGADWFLSLGCEKNGGTKLYGVSGRVRRPGLYELPMGTSLFDIVFHHAGGLAPGRKLKGVIPGGSSTPVLLPEEINVPMDFDSLARVGSMLGSGAVIVMDDTVCMVRVAARLARFYAHESCGQCTPCREGVPWMAAILSRLEEGGGRADDPELLMELCDNIQGNTICPLGEACAMPVRALVQKYRSEFERHVREGKCPFGPVPPPWNEV